MSIKTDGIVKYSVEGLSYETIEHAIIVGKRFAARYNRLVPMFDNIPDGDFSGSIIAIFGPKGEQFTTFAEARRKYPDEPATWTHNANINPGPLTPQD